MREGEGRACMLVKEEGKEDCACAYVYEEGDKGAKKTLCLYEEGKDSC